MLKRFTLKKFLLLILAVVLLVGGGFAIWQFLLKDNNASQQTAIEEPSFKETDNVLTFIGSDRAASAFNQFLGPIDVTVPLNEANASLPEGVTAKLVVFVPTEEAFETDTGQQLASVPADVIDDLKYYYFATFSPSADGTMPSLELTDGQRIVMLNGREVFVSKNARGSLVLTDAKGREATIQPRYVVDSDGSRIYFIDNILLLQ